MACCKAIIPNEFAGSSGRLAHDTDVSLLLAQGFVNAGFVFAICDGLCVHSQLQDRPGCMRPKCPKRLQHPGLPTAMPCHWEHQCVLKAFVCYKVIARTKVGSLPLLVSSIAFVTCSMQLGLQHIREQGTLVNIKFVDIGLDG